MGASKKIQANKKLRGKRPYDKTTASPKKALEPNGLILETELLLVAKNKWKDLAPGLKKEILQVISEAKFQIISSNASSFDSKVEAHVRSLTASLRSKLQSLKIPPALAKKLFPGSDINISASSYLVEKEALSQLENSLEKELRKKEAITKSLDQVEKELALYEKSGLSLK
ncbi:hypothetical protein DSO57_1004035 [Entomophthora muscae]|uniref:Uncharacterized protein n=1 Tax=Entomophthora muscae TaxID=34485 RepID=A0ACC2T8G8_9FUNG|nr:hypothetical protein DSO57_1004035 [Entomophthora muscae]